MLFPHKVIGGLLITQLHNHSHYSILDGRSRISELLSRTRELKQTAIALTDHGVMYGAMEFYRAALAADIKPIVGVEAYMAQASRLRKDAILDKGGSSYHVTLLAMDETGYRNLIKLTSKAHIEGFYYKPRMDFDLLCEFSAGLFVLSGCMSGEVATKFLDNDIDGARATIKKYRDAFGPERYAIEVHNHGHEKQKNLNAWLLDMAKEYDLRAVAACDSHYARPEDAESHDAMLAIQTGSTINDPRRFRIEPYGQYYLKSEEEMLRDFSGAEYAVANTMWVADKCNLKLDFSQVMLPEFAVPENETAFSWLRKQVFKGLDWRYGEASTVQKDRVDYELSIIEKTGYSRYFLIVQDYVNYARSQGVMAVPRGSVAGSLCVYALGICDIDPVKYDIMFERFLHSDRKGMPDVDMDFADDRRDDVIAYVTNKYGAERVAHIGTFSTLGARAAVKDVARVMDVDFGESNRFTALFPEKPDTTLLQVEAEHRIQEAMAINPVLKKVLKLAKELEGLTRGFGTHAAGLLITATDLQNVVPIQLPPEKGSRKHDAVTVVTQYDNNNTTSIIESLGLSKFDFLGLSNLTIIKSACELIRNRHDVDLYGQSGEKLYSELPTEYSDIRAKRTFDMLASGETTAVFQVESPGMRRALRMVKPTRITDLPAIVALYRPGPMENIPVFASAKNNAGSEKYLHDDLKPFLSETYGVVTYQDQVLLIARNIAGFSWGEVDVLRKGMGKKQGKVIEEQKQKFVSQSIARGYSPEVVQTLWEAIAPFAGYGFNKAHAFCYGYVAYITAYLKANYPVEYMSAVLAQEAGNQEKVAEAIAECNRLGVPIIPPDVNVSDVGFSITQRESRDCIVFGLSAIQGMGLPACKTIIATRTRSGQYTSFFQFLSVIDLDVINQRGISGLIKAGSLDAFGERNQLLIALPDMLDPARKQSKLNKMGQLNFLSGAVMEQLRPELPAVAPLTRWKRLEQEKEALGMYLSERPLDDVKRYLDAYCTHTSADITESGEERCIVGGMITKVRSHTQNDGKQMCFVAIEDNHGSIDGVIFARIYSQLQSLISVDSRVIAVGRINIRDDKRSVIIDDLVHINPVAPLNEAPETFALDIPWTIGKQKKLHRFVTLWSIFKATDAREGVPTRIRILSNKGDLDVVIPSRPDQHQKLMDILR